MAIFIFKKIQSDEGVFLVYLSYEGLKKCSQIGETFIYLSFKKYKTFSASALARRGPTSVLAGEELAQDSQGQPVGSKDC